MCLGASEVVGVIDDILEVLIDDGAIITDLIVDGGGEHVGDLFEVGLCEYLIEYIYGIELDDLAGTDVGAELGVTVPDVVDGLGDGEVECGDEIV